MSEDTQHAYVELSSMAAGLSRVRLQVSLPLRILMGVVGLVLLITCANIANLLLARATLRGREIAIRVAVGGSRLRLLRQVLIESVLLCFFAGSLAVAFAWWASQLLVSMVSAGLGALSLDVHLDGRVLTFAAAISLGTALLVGLVPALGSTSVSMIPALRQGKCFPLGGARNAIGKVLVVSQVALSVVLLAGAALLLRSLVNLSSVHPGFDASNALLIHLDTSVAGYAPRTTEVNNLYDQLEQRVAAVPGVRAASFAMLTFGEGAWQVPASVPGYLPRSENDNIIHNNVVGTNFFSAMGIRLLAGRSFSAADTKNSARVAIINETMLKRFFGQQSAIGKHFSIGDPGRTRAVEIVGVVSDAKLESLQEPPLPAAYFPYTQYQNYGGGSRYLYDLVVRYTGNSESIAVAVRQAINTVNRNLPISDTTTLSEQVNRSVVPQSLISRLSGFLSLFALFLACIGIYGLMSYVVSNQTRDIGIRIALGARYSNVQWMIMSEVLLLVSLGVVIGVPSALATGRLVASMLFRLTPMDPLSLVTAVGLMSAVAALAGYLPARRAAKVDPIVALRYE